MQLCVDENIVLGKEAFSLFGKVKLLNGREITRYKIKDCEILIVRSVTKVNSSLLENTKIRFVGTTTIGIDHINTEYLKQNKIFFAYAPGCNSYSVAEYVFSALIFLSAKYSFRLNEKTLGIIGVGNIGSKVKRFAEALGMKVIANDPPRSDKGEIGFSSLEETLSADIITFHVPLIKKGKYKTYHLLNKENLTFLPKEAIIINTSRGSVIDNIALFDFVKNNGNPLVLDVWENEPNPYHELVRLADISTPHIAGYSYDGKLNGTKMVFEKLNKFLRTNYKCQFGDEQNLSIIDCRPFKDKEEILRKIFNSVYRVDKDSETFKKKFLSSENTTSVFDMFRKNYPKRLELNHFKAIINTKTDASFLRDFRVDYERN